MAATPDRTRTIGASTSRAMIMMTIISTNPIGDGGGVSGQRGGGRKLKALIVGDGIHFFFLLWNFCGRLEKGEKVMGFYCVGKKIGRLILRWVDTGGKSWRAQRERLGKWLGLGKLELKGQKFWPLGFGSRLNGGVLVGIFKWILFRLLFCLPHCTSLEPSAKSLLWCGVVLLLIRPRSPIACGPRTSKLLIY